MIAEQSIIDEKEFNEKLSEVAKNAIADACTGSNPRIPRARRRWKSCSPLYTMTRKSTSKSRFLVAAHNLMGSIKF